jgi:type II secretory pathway pseudopilin PulG
MRQYWQRRQGYTLVELIVVVTIAILIMVVSLPVAKTVMEDARPREAGRIVNTAFFTAKARAASSGRLAGLELVLQRMNDPSASQGAYQCTRLYMCEVPPIYMGDTTDARATISGTSLTFVNDCAASLPSLLDPIADNQFEIRFNHRGLWYMAKYNGGGYQINLAGLPLPSIGPAGASFQIRRPPIRVGNPIELPQGTCIDMTYSGIGPTGTEFANCSALRLMFAPAGNLHSITIAAPDSSGSPTVTTAAPYGTVHFLIGQTGKIFPMQEGGAWNIANPDMSNIADARSLWVSVGRISGIITTNENNADRSALTDPSDSSQRMNFIGNCRKFATKREQKGGL